MDKRPQNRGYIFPGVKLHLILQDTAFKYCIPRRERPNSTRSLRVSRIKYCKSKTRITLYNDRSKCASYNAYAKGPKWVEPDGASAFGCSLSRRLDRVRWYQGWQLRRHGCRRSSSGSWRLEHREWVTCRRRARRRCRDRDCIKQDTLCRAVIREDYSMPKTASSSAYFHRKWKEDKAGVKSNAQRGELNDLCRLCQASLSSGLPARGGRGN
jgi:hypothetical protein